MIKLGGLITQKPLNEAEADKYTHVGYGKYKEKGKEDDKDAPTFEKDGEKFVPTKGDTAVKGGDSSAGKEVPKVNIFNKDKEEPKKDTSSKVSKSDLDVDKLVYNTRTKSVGIVRLPLERGEVKTDADGNVNADELEPYNPMKYPHQKDAKVAPSTKKEIESRKLFKPFAQGSETPTKDSTGDRAGNLEVNKAVRKKAQRMGITPQKLGKEEYQKKMAQAAVAALTDANFHSEARQLVADLEGKPELAEKPDYPDVTDPKFNEKMKVINDKYNSVYSEPDDDAEEIGLTASNEASWDGQDALDSIAFDLKMNGFKNMAAKLQSVIKESKSTRLKDLV